MVSDNLLEFILGLDRAHSRDLPPVARNEAIALLKDHELLARAWAGATARRINFRMYTTLRDKRRNIEAVMETELEDPAWWKAVREEYEQSSGKRDDQG